MRFYTFFILGVNAFYIYDMEHMYVPKSLFNHKTA